MVVSGLLWFGGGVAAVLFCVLGGSWWWAAVRCFGLVCVFGGLWLGGFVFALVFWAVCPPPVHPDGALLPRRRRAWSGRPLPGVATGVRTARRLPAVVVVAFFWPALAGMSCVCGLLRAGVSSPARVATNRSLPSSLVCGRVLGRVQHTLGGALLYGVVLGSFRESAAGWTSPLVVCSAHRGHGRSGCPSLGTVRCSPPSVFLLVSPSVGWSSRLTVLVQRIDSRLRLWLAPAPRSHGPKMGKS